MYLRTMRKELVAGNMVEVKSTVPIHLYEMPRYALRGFNSLLPMLLFLRLLRLPALILIAL